VIAWIAGPGTVKVLGPTRLVRLGEADGARSGRVERLRRAFEEGGVRAEAPEDIQAALWEKFLFVVPLGGVGAAARAPLGVLRTFPETRALIVEAMEEIAAVAAAAGVRLGDDAVARALGFLDGLAPGGTTSLQRDIVEGRRSELDAWNGAVVRLGRRLGVPTPVHRVLYATLLPQERAAAGA
jgi:2-dehydropantoate 2-reductase